VIRTFPDSDVVLINDHIALYPGDSHLVPCSATDDGCCIDYRMEIYPEDVDSLCEALQAWKAEKVADGVVAGIILNS
jgi:hypothetical protein